MKKNKQQKGSVTVILIIIILFAIGLGSYFYLENKNTSTSLVKDEVSDTDQSKKDMIDEIVLGVKDEVLLPLKLTKSVTWVSIEGTENSILYKYSMKETEDKISDDSIKENLVKSLCDTPSTRSILDNDINLDYLYSIENSTKTYSTSINKSDCI